MFGGSQNLHRVVGCPPHSKKCATWIAISKHGIIGLFFERGKVVTVTKKHYVPELRAVLERAGEAGGP